MIQIVIFTLNWTEHGLKNRNGGLYQLHIDNNNVTIFKNQEAGERCLVSLLDLYFRNFHQPQK